MRVSTFDCVENYVGIFVLVPTQSLIHKGRSRILVNDPREEWTLSPKFAQSPGFPLKLCLKTACCLKKTKKTQEQGGGAGLGRPPLDPLVVRPHQTAFRLHIWCGYNENQKQCQGSPPPCLLCLHWCMAMVEKSLQNSFFCAVEIDPAKLSSLGEGEGVQKLLGHP